LARERATEDKPGDAARKLAAIRDRAVALGKRLGASRDPAAIVELRTEVEGLAAALCSVEPTPPPGPDPAPAVRWPCDLNAPADQASPWGADPEELRGG
jgi:hypothetical protein